MVEEHVQQAARQALRAHEQSQGAIEQACHVPTLAGTGTESTEAGAERHVNTGQSPCFERRTSGSSADLIRCNSAGRSSKSESSSARLRPHAIAPTPSAERRLTP